MGCASETFPDGEISDLSIAICNAHPKTNMTMEKQPFKDAYHIVKNDVLSIVMLVFWEAYFWAIYILSFFGGTN